MKKTKLMTIIASALCVAGLLIGGIGFSALGFDITRTSNLPPFEQKQVDITEPVTKIVVDAASVNTEIIPSSDGAFHISYEENEKYRYEVNVENGVLTVRQVSHWGFFDTFIYGLFEGFSTLDKKLVVEVPDTFSGDLTANLSSGSSSISGLHSLKAVDTDCGSGYLSIDDIKCETLTAKNSSGQLDVKNSTVSGNFFAQGMSGGVWVYETSAGGDIEATNSSGWLTLEQVKGQNVTASISSGDLRLNGVISSTVDCRSSSGNIFFDDVDATRQVYRGSSGGIYGTVVGKMSDYTIHSSAGSGYNSLPISQPGGERELEASISSGSVKIGFSEE